MKHETEKAIRGKRRAAKRFEWMAALDAAAVLSLIFYWWYEAPLHPDTGARMVEAASLQALTGFGATVFVACLGYAAALRGIDSYANEVIKRD